MNEAVVMRMVKRRPYLLQLGPAVRAPIRPPRVNVDVTTENCAVVIGMHCGREEDREASCKLFFLQVRTSCGALSSAWRVVSGNFKVVSL